MAEKQLQIHTYCDDALGTLDGVGLAERIKSGEISSTEAVEAAIERARKAEPQINGIVTETFETALSLSKGKQSGYFGGLPTFLKDAEDQKGVPTLLGSRATPKVPATENSEFVEQLFSTGLISLGKTTLPEFGLTGTTECSLTGDTRNPWNLNHSSGGSSGGSAAMVAAGVVPVAQGNDGGGSTRIPAACCGLVGLKPTRSRLHDLWVTEHAPINIICQGLLTRSVRDSAVFYAEAEKHFHNEDLPKLGLVERPGKEGLKIGLFTDNFDGDPSHLDTVQTVVATGKTLEALGHHVETIQSPFGSRFIDDFLIYWAALAFSTQKMGKKMISPDFDPKQLEQWTLDLSRYYLKRIYKTPFVLKRLRKTPQTMASVFSDYDILLSPTLNSPAVEIGFLGTDVDFDIHFERVRRYCGFTPIQNAAGTPAISLPLGISKDGLPIGVHLAAGHGQEKRLLELAFELEEATPWPRLDQYMQANK